MKRVKIKISKYINQLVKWGDSTGLFKEQSWAIIALGDTKNHPNYLLQNELKFWKNP